MGLWVNGSGLTVGVGVDVVAGLMGCLGGSVNLSVSEKLSR